MKIVYAITKATWGGAQLYVYNLARYAKEHGHDVAVVAGNKGLLFEKLEGLGIRTILIPELDRDINPLLDTQAFFRLVSLFRTERPDVVHLNSSKIGGIGSLAARLTGIKKIVYTAHGWPFLEERPVIQKATIYFLSWLTALFSTDTIDITETTYNRVRRWPLLTNKLHLTYLGVDAAKAAFLGRNEAREKLGIPEGTFALGMIAELTANKGVLYALRALAHISNPAVQLFIIGGGELETQLKTEAHQLGISSRVHFLGFRESAAQYLKAFDVFLMSSLKEGLPLTIIEAGHASIPVIGTHVGGIPELLDRESGILVPAKDHRALAEAIEAVMENPELRTRLATRLNERVRAMFALKSMLKETFRCYSTEGVNYNPTALVIAINQEGKILLHLRDARPSAAPEQWCMIGGKVEEGESFEEAAYRETLEETGLRAQKMELLIENPGRNTKVYRAEVEGDDTDIVIGEGTAFKFFTKNEALNLFDSLPYTSIYIDGLRRLIRQNAL